MKETIRLADLVVDADFQYEYLNKQFIDYKICGKSSPDITICVETEDIAAERDKGNAHNFPDAYLESLAFYRKFATCVAAYDGLLFHCSAISVDGEGFLFGAPSGTGKSTHTRLYREYFGDRVMMVNDDKPIIRKRNGVFLVYGTPWHVKHQLRNNISVPVKGICFLKQGSSNEIRRLSVQEAFIAALNQVYKPESVNDLSLVISLLRDMILKIPAYELSCTISHDAVRLSYESMKGVC